MAKVVVVGAGIIGASISRQLAQRGAQVTVLEAAAAPAQGATKASWAWLNSNYKQPQHYKDFNVRSMQLWQQQHSNLATFCGCLMLHDERPDPQDPAYPITPVPAEQLLQLEPALSADLAASSHHARLFPLEGWCDPDEATNSFLQDAQQLGAHVLFEHKVESITIIDGKATQVTYSTSQPQQQQQQRRYAADAVVLAAGTGCPELAGEAGCQLPLLHKPSAIVMTSPLQLGLLKHMVISDTVFMLQRKDGRVLIGETRPEEASNTDDSSSNAQRILALAAVAVPALAAASIEGMYIGYRPYPADGYPVLGWAGESSSRNVYIAVTHSGMTLAPLVGQLVAEEVMAALSSSSSSSSELLAPYRPSRQFQVDGSGVRWAEWTKAGTS